MTSSTVLKEELNDNEVILLLALVFVRVPEISDTFALYWDRGSCSDVPPVTGIKNTRTLVVGEGLQKSSKGITVIVLESP